MNRVTHFEIHADNPQRASAFYSKIFGWKFEKWNGPMEYWMIVTGEKGQGINGGLTKRQKLADGMSINSYVCTIEVSSFDETAAKIKSNGGHSIDKKMAIPGMGWIGQFKDTEGNIFGIMQVDKSAQ